MSVIPECAILDPPFKLEGTPLEQKKAFFELAKSRIHLVSKEEHARYEQQIIPDSSSAAVGTVGLAPDTISVAVDLSKGGEVRLKTIRLVTSLYISINRDFFVPNGENFTDLIPLVIEHEICEAWLRVKRGYRVLNYEQQHKIARRREWALALQLGKTERLLEFCKNFCPWLLEEFALASKKFKIYRPAA